MGVQTGGKTLTVIGRKKELHHGVQGEHRRPKIKPENQKLENKAANS
jgi:hypothetical protein